MVEIAFKVDPESELYQKVADRCSERQKFHDLAREFFARNEPFHSQHYVQSRDFMMDLTEEEQRKYQSQILKRKSSNGMCIFRKGSLMQKKWTNEVVSRVDFRKLDSLRTWYFQFIDSGSCALWMSKTGDVYGYLSDKHKDAINLPPYMRKIKISEYYLAVEKEDEMK